MTEQVLKYTVIKTKSQYKAYVKALEQLDEMEEPTDETEKEIELLMLLVEKWDEDHNTFYDVDPVSLIKGLMNERDVKAVNIVQDSGVSKTLLSDILNYKKAMSKNVIRLLADYFKLSQEILNRPYKLKRSKPKQAKRNPNYKSPSRSKAAARRLQPA
jgi:HTH-type transcriptional regulator / antitoxin HigA